MKLPAKLLPDSCYTQGKPRVWLVPVTRRAYPEFLKYNFVSYRAMWSLEDDVLPAANKFEVLDVLDRTSAFIKASDDVKRLAASCMYDWMHKVKPHDFVVCFLGVGHLGIGEVLGDCQTNLDAESVLFKYARPARWSTVSLHIGAFNSQEQRIMSELREHVRKLDNLLSTRLLVATLQKAEHWTDPVLIEMASRFSGEYLCDLNPQLYAEYLAFLDHQTDIAAVASDGVDASDASEDADASIASTQDDIAASNQEEATASTKEDGLVSSGASFDSTTHCADENAFSGSQTQSCHSLDLNQVKQS